MRWVAAPAAAALVATGMSIVVWAEPASAFESNSTTAAPTGVAGGQSTALTGPSGLTTTVTMTGNTFINDSTSSIGTTGSSPSLFSPQIPTGTATFHLVTGGTAGTLLAGCAAGATCPEGTATVTFSEPVTNPVLDLYGLGAENGTSTSDTRGHAIVSLASSSPAGATFGAINAEATNLKLTGSSVDLINYQADTACNSTTSTTDAGDSAFAGCGSIPIIGTVTSVTFNLSYGSVAVGGSSNLPAADAFGLDFTFDQDFSDAPASYNATQAPAHDVGDLKLGASIDADNTMVANSTTSPFPQTGTSVNTGGDNMSGADEDAIGTPWPALTTAMIGSTYTVTVPMTGASRAGEVCGYLDFNGVGTFAAAADRACTTFASGATEVVLNWTVPATTTAGLTFARLRAAYGTAPTQAATPTGLASSGEVEDYALTIMPTITINESLPDGATGTFDLLINGRTFATAVGNGGTTGVQTVGQSLGSTVTTPAVVTPTDVTTGAITVPFSELATAGDAGTNTSSFSCVNGSGTTVVAATPGTSGSLTIPKSAASNGLAQNITCTFTNLGTSVLALVKTVTPTTVATPGSTVTYTFAVTNSGNQTITGLAIADTQTLPAGSLQAPPTCTATTLAPTASTSCTGRYVVTQADLDNGSINDSATASGADPAGNPVVSNSSLATVTVIASPSLALTKAATPSTVTAAGQTVAYTFAVTNTGNVTVHGVAITDTLTAPALNSGLSAISCPATTLAPQASTSCTASYVASQQDIDHGKIDNSATVAGLDPKNQPTPPSTPSIVEVSAVAAPALNLVKTASVASVPAAGTTVTYSFAVTNSGNVTLTGLAVTDAFDLPAFDSGLSPITCAAGTLAPNASTTCTATYVTTQADIDNGSITNTAKAHASDPSSAPVTSNNSAATVGLSQAPQLTLIKTATPTSITQAGQTVMYSFAVTNSGNVTVTNLAIDDTLTVPALASGLSAISCLNTTLGPSASTTCSATYVSTQADVDNGNIHNSATATGADPNADVVTSNSATADVTIAANPSLTVAKTAMPGSLAAAGTTVTYSFAVTNTGNVTLTAVAVTDSMTAPALDAGLSAVDCPDTTLAPAGSVTCTATYIAAQADIDHGSIDNSATATGTPPQIPGGVAPTPVTSASTAHVDIPSAPALTVVKSSATTAVSVLGFVITYHFTVTNAGNVTLSGVGVSDAQASPAGPLTSAPACQSLTSPVGSCSGGSVAQLVPGQVADFTATYTVTQADLDNGSLSDTATASGTPPQIPGGVAPTPITSAPSTLEIPTLQFPALTVVKSSATTAVSVLGFVITYHFTVTNAGNVTLSGVGVSDAQASPAGPLTSAPACQSLTSPVGSCSGGSVAQLVPGQVADFTATYTVTQADLDNGSLSDTATASGTPPQIPGGVAPTPITSAPSTLEIPTLQFPAITVVKSSTTAAVAAVGAVVPYTFTATNAGNVTLSGVGITDTPTAPAGSLTTAPSCQSLTSPSGTCAGATATLAPNQSATFTATYTVTQADLNNGSITDSAIASGMPPQIPGGMTPTPISSSPSAATIAVNQLPTLMVVKSSSVASVSAVGDVITYQFLVTNTGNVDVNGVSVADTQTSPAGPLTTTPTCQSLAPAGTCSGSTTTLVPGQSAIFTATYTIAQADLDNGSVNDSATASGTPVQVPGGTGGTVPTPITSDPSPLSVPATQSPALELVKSASPATVIAAGATVTYTFAVTNTGNVTVGNLAVSDVMASPALDAGVSAIGCAAVSLAPGASTTCTATYVVSLADANNGSVANTATAGGLGPHGQSVVSPPSSAVVTVKQSPSISLVKSASVSSFSAAGQTVTYSFLVTNTGNVTLESVTVNDSLTAPATGANLSAISCPLTSLDPGGSTTCTASYVTTQADVDNGSLGNSATVSGLPPQIPAGPVPTPVVSSPSTATVSAVQTPALTLVKSANTIDSNGDGGIGVGDQIGYSFLVTNSGNTTLLNVVVSDPALGAVTCPPISLVPGASLTCTGNGPHTITQSDVDAGNVEDTALAMGAPIGCPGAGGATCPVVTSNQSSADVPLHQAPDISMTKSGSYAAGRIVWTITVTNSGNITLINVTVSDPKAGTVNCPSSTLAPGASEVCTTPIYTPTPAEYASGTVTNTAIGTGDYVGPVLISKTANASAIVALPVGISFTDPPGGGGLVFTGGPVEQVLAVAIGFLIAGLGVLFLSARRRRA